jgi:hypothetical protein
MSFQELQKMGRFAHFWDAVANSGNFKRTVEFFRERCRTENSSFFAEFFRLSEFLSQRHPNGHGIALLNLVESIWIYLTHRAGLEASQARELLIADYTGQVKRDIPRFLKDEGRVSTPSRAPFQPSDSEKDLSLESLNPGLKSSPPLPKRQTKHWSGAAQSVK